MDSLRCFSVSPINLGASLAQALVHSGGVGILDLEFMAEAGLAQAQQTLATLMEGVQTQSGGIGLRLRADQVEQMRSLLEQIAVVPHWLIVSGWDSGTLAQILGALPGASQRQVLLDVVDRAQVAGLELPSDTIAGLVARGHECGGWVGEDAAFILFQKLMAAQPALPIYVQGGIGIHTAAACRAAGAAGVILDDQLWLMPESPLPAAWQAWLKNLNGQEAIPIGERLGLSCRVLSRPSFKAIPALQQLADQVELQLQGQVSAAMWQTQANPLLGWSEPGQLAWPMGQSVGLAAQLRDRYQTTAAFVQALLTHSEQAVKLAHKLQPLQAGGPLAASHGTTYPIVQGPMTRVSDTAEFANAVAQGGALPLLALALMKGGQVRSLLEKTRDLAGDRPWGIGLLGFVSQSLREEQIAVVNEIKPKFALIAGGRPDQAAKFEAQGIATYLHVPAPRLLSMFLEQGAKRFVFEGRECGGHVGPLSSFVLWDSMIETLLAQVSAEQATQMHILFAGGIHDARSAAMVSAMAAPLAERGMKVGVLMGTSYLFTVEAVSCGAILPGFQAQALACERTINLETGPGHASRCVVTPFANEFYATRRAMMARGSAPEDIKNTLEDLTLGRLRIASKGLMRDPQGQVITIEPAQQQQDGMYMIGQVATLRHQVCTVADLHRDISQGSAQLLSAAVASPSKAAPVTAAVPARGAGRPSDIAIIGIGTLLPQAQEPDIFWSNILNKVDAITEIPSERWDWRLYYDEDRHARDKIYSKWGGFLSDVLFDPMKFGIPPKSLKSIEPIQLLALETVRRALADAGVAYEAGNFDREHTSVILGAGGGLADLGAQYATRSEIPRFVEGPTDAVWDRLPEWTEESFPGILLNVIAGRVSNRFNLGGSNFTVDAACASSLAALDLAVQELETGRSNVVITGGVDSVQSPFTFFCFSKTQALSPRGRSRSFDQTADGIAISEGLAMVVLKRLEDAERDGDRIYAVIKGVAGSSDGKALGLTAPLPAGQMRALDRAYGKAGFSPNTLGLYEAHGTGTPTGDRVELETIVTTLKGENTPTKGCAIGSVKTMIGHTKATAGIAGLVKATLALHHKVIPPHGLVETPLEPIADPTSPLYLPKEGQPWLAHPDHPRRAGVSAFGFGGTNFHAILEEYRGASDCSVYGGTDWPWEWVVLRAPNPAALLQDVNQLQGALVAGAQPALRDLAFSYAQQAAARAQDAVCLSLVVHSLGHLSEALTLVQKHLTQGTTELLPPHIQLGLNAAATAQSVAFLFPGQGSQYPGMLRELALYCPELRDAIEAADRQLAGHLPQRLSQYLYPPSAYTPQAEEQGFEDLKQTQIAQPLLGAVEAGLLDVLARLEIRPTATAGQSYGEYAALYAAQVFNRHDFFALSETRGRLMAEACTASDGAMAALRMTRVAVQAMLQTHPQVVIANHNAPLQVVISGPRAAVQQVVDAANATGPGMARMLAVAGAFHSPLVNVVQVAIASTLSAVSMQVPKIPVFANETAFPYPAEPGAIREQLARHVISPVNFVDQIQHIYDQGTRVFIEVGPKSVLTNMVGQILEGKPFRAVSLDGQGGGLRGFLCALGGMATAGVAMNPIALYRGRLVNPLDLAQLAATTTPVLPKMACWLSGGGVRTPNQTASHPGKTPPLTLETAAERAVRSPVVASAVLPFEPLATATVLAEPAELPAQQPQPVAQIEAMRQEPSLGDSQTTSVQPLPMTVAQRDLLLMPDPIHPVTVISAERVSPMSKSSLSQPIPSGAVDASASRSAAILGAYQSYQETMRQFLGLQERIMNQFLSHLEQDAIQGSIAVAQMPAPPSQLLPTASLENLDATIRAAEPVAMAAVSSLANGNGNKVALLERPISTEVRVAPVAAPVVAPPVSIPAPVAVAAPVVAPPVSIPAPVAPPVPSGLDPAQVRQMLLDIVSDRTGYPAEMLGLEQDMEAELGIDSIKRVEILGAFQKMLPAAVGTMVQEQMESLTRVKSLQGLVDQVVGQSATVVTGVAPVMSAPVVVPASSPAPVVAPAPSGLDPVQVKQMLLDIVSDRTGYPAEMLGLDQDMEAELGIDSIKRVEILGALQKSLPASVATVVQDQMESLTRVKSLKGVVDQVVQYSQGSVLLGK